MAKFWRGAFWFGLGVIALFVIINWQFFNVKIGFWWQHEVLDKPVELEQEIQSTPDRIAIPSLGIEAPLVYIDAIDELTMQQGLTQGVVHYPGTALPGEYGNAFFFGHSSDYPTKPGDYKTVFALLPDIEVGATIQMTDTRGRLFEYEVFEKLVVSPTQTEFLDLGNKTEKLLTLQTSYPVGTALQRYIVKARIA